MRAKARSQERQSVKSADRALLILEYFSDRRTAATVGEVSEALKLPQSSASMLVKSMTQLGYLSFSPETRKFRPTYRVALLGEWLQRSLLERGPLTDMMERIQRETEETVVLGLQNGPHVQYVHIAEADESVRFYVHVGTLRPMTRAALGLVLLTLKSESEIRAIVRRNNADAKQAKHRVSERQFLTDIDSIRKAGYAESGGRLMRGGSLIAMIVPTKAESPPLALGVGGPIERIAAKRDQILEVLQSHLGTDVLHDLGNTRADALATRDQ
jgi:DNA-binding IclR family transcriptional regulator